MAKTEMIRAFLLEAGDRFILWGKEYKVFEINKTKIVYGDKSYRREGQVLLMGKNSRQKIELICKQNL